MSGYEEENELYSVCRQAHRGLKYKSLDDMAREEGVAAVLSFLATQPTIVGGLYRHTNMPVLPFIVRRWDD